MLEKMPSADRYGRTRRPLRVTEQMRRDAEELEKEEAIRSGEEVDEKNLDGVRLEERLPKIKEKNLREDHSFYASRR